MTGRSSESISSGKYRDLRRSVALSAFFLRMQILLGGAAYWAVLRAGDNFQPTLTYVLLTVGACARAVRLCSPLP